MTTTAHHGSERREPPDERREPLNETDGIHMAVTDDEMAPKTAKRGLVSGRGGLISLITVVALTVATFATVFGVPRPDSAVASYDALAWVWSGGRGEADRVNAETARVDTRARIEDSQNHTIDISQTDEYLILHDLSTGQVSALDLTTLQVGAVLPTTPGLGVSVALDGDSAFVIDSVQGQVRQLDARSLTPVGDSIVLPPRLVAGGFDGKGLLWVGLPGEGTVVAIKPGTGGASPTVRSTTTVTGPGHDLELSTLDQGVAVLDNTTAELHLVNLGDRVAGGRPGKVDTVRVPIESLGVMPSRTVGRTVVITVPDQRQVLVVKNGETSKHIVPGRGDIEAAVAYAGHVYAPDAAAGKVYDLDGDGKSSGEIDISAPGGELVLDVREGYLFINAPNGSTARVVNDKRIVKPVDKYAEGVLGADPPPPAPPAPPPVTVPGKPKQVTASAGDASVTIGWGRASSGGAPITKYVVQGAGKTIAVGSGTRSVLIDGLSNGKTYTFTVHAVNRLGAGPGARSPKVMPTAEVPFPPASVSAKAQPDGTVVVTWKAADGGGRKIASYLVTATGDDAQAPLGSVKNTSMTVAEGMLEYGTQYAFSVVAVNDRGAGSEPSELSNTVVPFRAPDAPADLSARTDPRTPGTIQVSWRAPADNGRPVTGYLVTDGAGKQATFAETSATLDGYGDDEAVQVSVSAINEAGEGPAATTTARTMAAPSLTLTSDSSGYNDLTVTLTPNGGGGAATCRVQVSGGGAVERACDTAAVSLKVTGLWPNETYDYTVSVTNAVGSASETRERATTQMRFTVLCDDSSYCGRGVWAYRVPSQADDSDAVAELKPGSTHTPQCRVTGSASINAEPWGGKKTKLWLGFQRGGKRAYFPWAWAKLDGGDVIARLPGC